MIKIVKIYLKVDLIDAKMCFFLIKNNAVICGTTYYRLPLYETPLSTACAYMWNPLTWKGWGEKTRYYVGPHITAAVQNKYLRYFEVRESVKFIIF